VLPSDHDSATLVCVMSDTVSDAISGPATAARYTAADDLNGMAVTTSFHLHGLSDSAVFKLF